MIELKGYSLFVIFFTFQSLIDRELKRVVKRPRKMIQNLANSTLTFPQKLFALMEFELGDVVDWMPHGFSFRIIDVDKFADEIVPRYFKRKLQHCCNR